MLETIFIILMWIGIFCFAVLILVYGVVDLLRRRALPQNDPSTEEQLRLFYDLLATIHRDGGHYQAKHGILKAHNDAIDKVTDWIFYPSTEL